MMEFRRNPRLYNDQINEVRPLRPLPVTPVKQKRSVISRALYPLIMVAAYGLMYYFNQTSLTMLLFPVIMLIPALVVPAIEDRQNWKEAMDVYNAEIIAYNEYLDALDLEFEQIKQSYQLWNAFDFPGTAEELDRCKNLDATLWCKRAEYNDFMNVCVGTYSAKFPVQLEVDYEQMVLHRDDKLKDKIKKLLDKYDVIENTPLIVNLRNHPCLGVCDNSSLGITQEYLAGILLSAIYSYGYDEVKIVVLAKNEPSNSLAEGKYQWTRWLPHCWDEDKKYRFFAATDSEKTNVLLYLTNICQERVAHEGLHLPHYLVLVEDVEFFEKNGIQRFFTQRKNTVGVSLIYISDTKGLPSQAESIVNINKMNSTFTNASMFGLAEIEITPRKAEIYDVEELSRFLSSVQLTDDSRTNELPSLITLFDLYGERSLSPNSIALNWAKNYCYTDGIHAVLGKKSPTEVMDLDMSDEHDGAHMLVAGTTGSGKSEFLQTFVVALASRYSPDEVSFVFIDFKEGGMSESFKELPHNAGSLTNIDDEIDYFAGRAITMLNNERKRRAKLLEPYGQKINRYHEAYHESGEHLVALPHLFIVIDEFAEVIAQCSEFKEMIISLSRVGRSLGIHLILATQSPSQSVDSQIWSNSNCKICLKVLNDDESNAVLKVKDAAYIQTRGRAYCLTGGKPGLIEFQTAWSGAPTSAKFLATKIEVINGVNERLILSKELGNIYTASTQLSQVCDTCKIVKTASGIALPHNVLTPSLPTEIKLQLDGEGFISGRHITDMYIGVGDFITEHKQEKVSISLGNGNNHLLIAGAPNSGRSNAVGQLVSQLEATCNASDIQFYIIQYGSKSLRSFDNSHIVAEYITNLVADISETEEKIGRTLTFIREIIKQRQIDNNSLNEPRLVFVIDGWNQLISAFEFYPEELLSIMSLNPVQYGVHFVLVANTELVGYRLSPYFDTKIFMKYDKSVMSIEDFSYEGSVLPRKGRALMLDTVLPYPVEIQTFEEVQKPGNKPIARDMDTDRLLHIPTFDMAFSQRGTWARKLYQETNGDSILLGMCKKTLEWAELSFGYHGVAMSYVDILPKDAFVRYIISSFTKYKVVLLEEESRRHYFSGDIVTSNDHEYLKEWAEQLKENTVVIIDYPGLAGNDCDDYTNLKMYPWQEVLRDKMAAGKMLIIWIEHVSRARNNSFFSDAISSYQKRIAMGGRGERHPYFSDRLDSSNIYLDSADAFVSLDGGDCMVVRTMIDV